MVDDPPMPLTTFKIPPLPTEGSRKIVSMLCRLPGRQLGVDLEGVVREDVHPLVEEAVAAHPGRR